MSAKLFSIILIFSSIVFGQYFEQSKYSGVGIPYFELSINRQFSYNLEQTRVLITAQILHDDITFIKSDTSGFDAELEWIIAAYDDKEKLVYSRTVSHFFNVPDYESTNSREEKFVLKSDLELPSGEYDFLFRTIDLITKKSSQKNVNIKIIPYYEEDLVLSDILLLNSIQLDSTGFLKDYEPIIGSNFTARDGHFYLYFSVFSKKTDVPAEINFKFLNSKNKVEFDSLTVKQIKSHITSHILKLNKDSFSGNRYTLEINVKADDEKAKTTRALTFFWKEFPSTIEDIDLALKQMVYIINTDSLDYYLDEATLDEKQEYFKRFWKQRDPNPQTVKNELMDEYFKRINFANRNYSGFTSEGWQTDLDFPMMLNVILLKLMESPMKFGATTTLEKYFYLKIIQDSEIIVCTPILLMSNINN